MSSGKKTMVINTQERAISTDINRLQTFAAADDAELFRYLLSARSGGEEGPGVSILPVSAEAPLSAEIIGGLMVRPVSGSFGLSIDAGIVYAMMSDAGIGDSDYKYVRSPGLIAGTLIFGANASGSIRIDVVECRINPVPDLVTDNRDIFNPSTNLFVASVVTKESTGRLEFRIRAGVGGAGYPGNVSGWLPLMVASIPSGAASNDNSTFWDVRPLAEDREMLGRVTNPGGGASPRVLELDAQGSRPGANSLIVEGRWKAQINGRIIGGQFRRTTGGVEQTSIDLGNVVNSEVALLEPLTDPGGPWIASFLYACLPKGLPRWAMYAPAPGTRIPRTPKGLLVVSQTFPDFDGRPIASIALPAATGLGGSTTTNEAVCISILGKTNGTNLHSPFHASGKELVFANDLTLFVSGGVAGQYDWTFFGISWPPHAKEMLVSLNIDVILGAVSGVSGLGDLRVHSTLAAAAGDEAARYQANFPWTVNATVGALSVPIRIENLWIARPQDYPGTPDGGGFTIRWLLGAVALYGPAPTLPATATMRIQGFRF